MEKYLEEEDKIIIKDFKNKITSLKVEDRKKAVALYRIFTKIIKIEERRKKINDQEYEKYNKKLTKITTETGNIIEGKKKIEKPILENWKKKHEKNLEIPSKLEKSPKIKNFWKYFILNNDLYIGQNDDEILETLEKIEISTMENSENPKQRQIIFSCIFSKNNFFTNEKLTTKLFYNEETITKSKGTKIDWKKNPTIEKVKKIQKNKRTGKKRIIYKEIQKRSFFEIFKDFSLDSDILYNVDEELASMDIDKLDENINEIIDTLPYALEYYLDVRPEEEFDEKTDIEGFSSEEGYMANGAFEGRFEPENRVLGENKGFEDQGEHRDQGNYVFDGSFENGNEGVLENGNYEEGIGKNIGNLEFGGEENIKIIKKEKNEKFFEEEKEILNSENIFENKSFGIINDFEIVNNEDLKIIEEEKIVKEEKEKSLKKEGKSKHDKKKFQKGIKKQEEKKKCRQQ